MDWVTYIIMGVFVIFVAIMSMRQRKQNRGKTYDQRRDELYEYSQKRLEEFHKSESDENKGINESKETRESDETKEDEKGKETES